MSELPRKLGKYEVTRELGRGAMGIVYEAFDPSIERTVALKTIRRDQLDGADAAEAITRFQREAKAAGRLQHPNIVSIHDFGEENGTMYIAMEFVHGRELRSFFDQNERFDVAEISRLMGQLLEALEYSHNYGVVHRDIKPANIILQPNRQLKVADFGIARIESSQYTQAGTVLGTPAYMSPEQFMGQTVDRRSDIFSAGVVLYQFLTGEKPFSGAATTIMHKVLSVDPPPPSVLNVQVPKAFDVVIAKAMAKRPQDRFQNAREFAVAIRMAAEGNAATGLAAAADATEINTGTATVATTTAPRRNSLAIAAVAAGAIAIGSAGYWVALRPHPGNVPALAGAQPAPASASALAPEPVPVPAAVIPAEPGSMIISAVGLANPSDRKYQSDKALLASDLRADGRAQLVEKAIALYIDRASLTNNYDLLRDKLLSNSADYITAIVQEGAPQVGKDGLMYITTQAAVKVREVQKSLNQMSRDERVKFIRNNGDPKISVAISVRGDAPGAVAQSSPVAENLLKERIKSFGFRIWSDDAQSPAGPGKAADFVVIGEAKLKKLSAKLEASGITIEKIMLTSWTVKCIDKQSGEEIYFNNKLPAAVGSWATEEQALSAIGSKIADEFSRDFFIQHFNASGRRVTLKIDGLPAPAIAETLVRELIGLQPVISVVRQDGGTPASAVYDLQVSGGTVAVTDLIANAILKPLNAKLGKTCFSLGATRGDQVEVAFEQGCGDKSVLSRLETNPPASLYVAPPGRQKSILKDPEAIRKLAI